VNSKLYGPGQPRPLIGTLLLAAFVLLPSMASIGMFVDGAMYAAISRNLAEGLGSFWAPHFSDGLFPVFHQHPPLVFWLQSSFFRLLGDSYLTERVFDLVVLLVTAWLMRALWLGLTRAAGLETLSAYWWLPLLLWVVVPKWSWAYRNNVLENSLTMFCLLSVLLAFGACRSVGVAKALVFAAAAGGAALLAFLAKGPVGLFVLVAPVLLLPAVGSVGWRRSLIVAGLVSGVFFALLGLVLLAWPGAREMLAAYWQDQVAGRAGVSGAGLGMLVELLKKIAPMLVVLAVLRVWVWREPGSAWWRPVRGACAAMLAIGLSASLPLALGDLDSAHYLIPALPFFALGFGLVAASMLHEAGDRTRTILKRRPGTLFMLLCGLAAAAILAESVGRIGEVRKNERYHAFLSRVAAVTGQCRSLAVDDAVYEDWYMHAVAQRHYRISLLPDIAYADWRLAPARQDPPSGYQATQVASGNWVLQRRAHRHPPTPDCINPPGFSAPGLH